MNYAKYHKGKSTSSLFKMTRLLNEGYRNQTYEYELHILLNMKLNAAKDNKIGKAATHKYTKGWCRISMRYDVIQYSKIN